MQRINFIYYNVYNAELFTVYSMPGRVHSLSGSVHSIKYIIQRRVLEVVAEANITAADGSAGVLNVSPFYANWSADKVSRTMHT